MYGAWLFVLITLAMCADVVKVNYKTPRIVCVSIDRYSFVLYMVRRWGKVYTVPTFGPSQCHSQ